MTSEIDPKAAATLGDLQTVLAMFNDAMTKRDQQNEARFNQIASVMQQVVDKVNQTQPQQQSTSNTLANIDKGELLSKAIDKIADKFLNTEQPTELQNISELLAKAMIREVVLSGKARARVALRKGYLFAEETEGILEDNVTKAIVKQHGPI